MLYKPFPISNGTRQGCPLSPLIFNLVMEPLAEKIRSQLDISGFVIGTMEHKINVFVDNVILMMTNPTSSLASVQKTLDEFSSISHYKVNASKSHILPLRVSKEMQTTIESTYLYTWTSDSLTYLGVKLTTSASSLYRVNFVPFLDNLHKEIEKITKHALSWSGRLVAFKMIDLPQLLNLFRTLPIPVPISFFTTVQNLLGRTVWYNKKSITSQACLIKHRSVRGVGYICIKDYYIASHFNTIQSVVPTQFFLYVEQHWGSANPRA